MRKFFAYCLFSCFAITGFTQSLHAPATFLGYAPGTAYTPHYKIVEYCKTVAQAHPQTVKLVSYGKTYEGRELLLLFISSSANIQRLEEIRANNLRLAGLSKDKAAPVTTGAPAIAWLSYNVHGNEPSSSEAALQTIYTLVNDTAQQVSNWLKNTVVIIDPCLNPDGRDRYVNWFNSMKGNTPNPDVQSREHNEPWPGGRSNHYNFDLNRDWAWQTQAETQQRLVAYNQWMPQVHIDFHEQYIDNPYYFAPAAEPVHEVITPWQKHFETLAGKNNAKYFDEKGWLYFTRQEFDLFYPSYGDTYPMYNGAIGMTYEQAGNSRGGLSVINSFNDTVTLAERIQHHYTTGIATVETVSQQAEKLVTEFKKYFDESSSGKDLTYKTYVITANEPGKLEELRKLLEANLIYYGTTESKTIQGYNYTTGKEGTANLLQYNIAIPAAQPKARLVKVLFDPANRLNDSVTYDITAWSLPYVFGLQGYALKESPSLKAWNKANNYTPASSAYGYLLPYNSISSVRMLAALLKQHIKVRYADKPFTYGGRNYDRGTLIILRNGNVADFAAQLNKTAQQFNLQPVAVTGGFMDSGADFGSPDVKLIKEPKIAVLTGNDVSANAAGEIWHLFDQSLQYPVTLLNAEDLPQLKLSAYNVLIIPDGELSLFNNKSNIEKLKEFVRSGGKLIALENAVQQLAAADWGIKVKDDPREDTSGYNDLKKYGDRMRGYASESLAGAIFRVDLDETHPLAYGLDEYYTLKLSGKVFNFLKEGWNAGYIKKNNYRAGFAGSQLKGKLIDGLVFGTQSIGSGLVIYFTDDPLFRRFWKSGELLFCNAVFLGDN